MGHKQIAWNLSHRGLSGPLKFAVFCFCLAVLLLIINKDSLPPSKIVNEHIFSYRKTENSKPDDTLKGTENLPSSSIRISLSQGSEKLKTNSDVVDSNELVDKLTKEFSERLSLPVVRKLNVTSTCKLPGLLGNSCEGPCRRTEIDTDVKSRVSQILQSYQSKMPTKYLGVLDKMASQVKGHYDVVIATGSSDNHFTEAQAVIENIHTNVFPILKNFTFIFYNLGLSQHNRALVEKHCKCQIIDFPFNEFPDFFKNLNCYVWKPAIISAHTGRSNVFIWGDTSVRFQKDPKQFFGLLNRTRERGFQLYGPEGIVATRTKRETFHYFGEEACAYITFENEIQGGFGFYSTSRFVRKLILDPWLSCAFDKGCMCISPANIFADGSNAAYNNWKKGKSSMVYGLCHRFDQAALNILVYKLYRERALDIVNFGTEIDLQRAGNNYFTRLEAKPKGK